MFEKILIANRGEIAIRVIRACRELGIRSVAVYSEADVTSLHTRFADEAICIGPAQSAKSYLNIAAIISAAEIADVEAIHPGYGFLAENAHFAEICESCGIRFIGPRPENIRLMGDKVEAIKAAKRAGVTVIPGSEGVVTDRDAALRIAKRVGYPVMVKAVAGGGGKGMRLAHNDVSLANAFLTAQAEAEAAFGNPAVYVEKRLDHSRHIEVQILADGKGKVIHLFERDCSIQRRHQKLIEESPSPRLSPRTRAKIGRAAVRIAEAIGYVNAGTVEFLLDRDENFYFLEMNTRIQVEHPVTEMVTQVDIVKEQLRISSGHGLKLTQSDVRLLGHAIECRVNAEDWERDFSSCPGKVTMYHAPGGPGVRVDSHVYAGYDIPSYYDSMVSKVICVGHTRESAVTRMQRALDEYVIGGIKTTIPFHRLILSDPRFRKGKYSTDFVDELLEVQKKKKA
ncbi:MAG: acetyl-CoA carboxylase biotin carboxylase subunit [Candidatus Aureabacteria bacterium]|nr:acetyl-CoA carboxylase biotin carboxylase subunit [Candidatus Auribacterota bacterium]